jgi:hypothetical protein
VPTRGETKALLGRYVGANNNPNDRIDLVRERYIRAGNYKGLKETVRFVVYPDAQGRGMITLPRRYSGIIGLTIDGFCGGLALPVRNPWYDFAPGGANRLDGSTFGRGAIPIEGRFTTFADWNVPLMLRIKVEQPENPGTIIFRGTLNGQKLYSLNSSAMWIEGVALDFSNTTATTAQVFDAPPYSVVKPVTQGRIFLYTVDADGLETLVAIYEPTETLPKWRRYKVPVLPSFVTSPQAPVQVPPSGTGGVFYTKSEIDAMFGDAGVLTVNTDGTDDLSAALPYALRTIQLIAQAGVGPYTHNFTLNRFPPKVGAIYRIRLQVDQSSNQILVFYDQNVGGTLLYQVNGDSSNQYFVTLVFEFDGNSWHYSGTEP